MKIRHHSFNILFISASFFFFVSPVNAQEHSAKQWARDSSLIKLNRLFAPSGIILKNTVTSSLALHQLDGIQNFPIDFDRWNELNHQLNAGSSSNNPSFEMETLIATNREIQLKQVAKTGMNITPVFIRNIRYESITPTALENHLLEMDGEYYKDVIPRNDSPYESATAFFGGIMEQELFQDEIHLWFSKSQYYSNRTNDELIQIEINTNDGTGFQPIAFETPVTLNYSNIGTKLISIRYQSQQSTQLITISLKVSSGSQYCTAPYAPDNAPWSNSSTSINSNLIHADIPFEGKVSLGNAYIKYGITGPPNVLDKPFILVEGIDFGTRHVKNQNGDLGFCQMFGGGNNQINNYYTDGYDHDNYFFMNKYPIMIEDLRNHGYDVIMLDFYDGADYVERNSMLLVKLIELVNQYKSGCEQNVVAGASMGGQVSRYALTYMEQHNMDHDSRMYLSMDSPHKGSYIPAGLQHMLKFMSFQTMEILSADAQSKYLNTLARPAAMELLNYNVVEGATVLHDNYYTQLSSLGYPHVRKLGIANGNRQGVSQGFLNGANLFHFSFTPWTCFNYSLWEFNAFASPGGGLTNYVFKGKAPSSLGAALGCLALPGANCAICMNASITYSGQTVNMPSYSAHWDNCPGGKRKTMYNLERDLKEKLHENSLLNFFINPEVTAGVENHSFIPTISALDVNTNDFYFDLSGLFSISDYNHALQNPSLCPFDAVFAPSSGNEQHSEATMGNISFALQEVYGQEGAIPLSLSTTTVADGIFNYVHGYQKISSTQVQNGAKLCVNTAHPANYLLPVFTPAPNTSLELFTSKCGPVVEINAGGEFIIGDENIHTNAKVTFREGSVLRLKTGSRLLINNHSSLIMMPGSQFFCEEGVEIVLSGSDSRLIVNSNLVEIPIGINPSSNSNWLKITKGNNTDGGLFSLYAGALRLYDQSQLIIESCKLEMGTYMTLDYFAGANIILNGDKANLDFIGYLHLNTNSEFTFSGEGFISFSKADAPFNNIAAENETSIKFIGANNNDEVLRVNQKYLSVPDHVKELRIVKSKVLLGENSFIITPANGSSSTPDGAIIYFSDMKVSSISGVNNNHEGIQLKGQLHTTIDHCIFEFGKYGLNARLHVKQNNLQITQSVFRNNKTGLKVYGRGIKSFGNTFTNNDCGIYLAGAETVSLIAANKIEHNNSIGIHILAGSSGDVQIINSYINENAAGILDNGANLLSVSCSEIKNNSSYGISVQHNAKLNLSSLSGAGYVNLSGNSKAILCQGASALYLNEGYNDFTPSISSGPSCPTNQIACTSTIEGTLSEGYGSPAYFSATTISATDVFSNNNLGTYYPEYLYCSSSNLSHEANHNVWSSFSTMSPRYNEDYGSLCYGYTGNYSGEYGLRTSYLCPINPNSISRRCRKIYLTDNLPLKTICGNLSNGTNDWDYLSTDIFTHATGESAQQIHSKTFNDVSLIEAIRQTNACVETNNFSGYLLAAKQYAEILGYMNYDKPTDTDRQLFDLVYKQMMSSIGLASHMKSANDEEEFMNILSEILSLQNTLMDYYTSFEEQADVYFQKMPAWIDIATSLRLAGKREESLTQLNQASRVAREEDLAFIEEWKCILQNELNASRGDLGESQDCGFASDSYRITGNNQESQELASLEIASQKVNITPNPSHGKYELSIGESIQFPVRLLITDITGRERYTKSINSKKELIDISEWSNGVYLIKIISEKETIVKKLVKN